MEEKINPLEVQFYPNGLTVKDNYGTLHRLFAVTPLGKYIFHTDVDSYPSIMTFYRLSEFDRMKATGLV